MTRKLIPGFVAAMLVSLSMMMPGGAAEPFSGISGDKTLVVWATLSDMTQRGIGLLTLDDRQSHFDGIVYGELEESRWMAGSDFYRRTLRDQADLAAETAKPDQTVQIAAVYRGKEITVFRNGVLYSRHAISEPQSFDSDTAVVMGLRHLDVKDRVFFAGTLDDARIYGTALTAEQLKSLKPNQPSDPKPLAWWHFEKGNLEDAMGLFPPGKLMGKARVDAGRLILDGQGSYFVTPPDASASSPISEGPKPAVEWILNYHLMHPGGESLPGDPNAAFYLDGVYHLHYIVAHPWKDRQSFSFMHVTSPDMLHWKWETTKLQPALTGHGMFSGTGFLTKEGRPAAIYHGESSGRNQIAIAKDRKLSAWEKPYAVEVQNADGSEAKMNHWDPDCFLIGDTYYAISGGPNPPLFKSKDLRRWTLVGDFLRHQMPDVALGEDISCPNFFRLGDQWMLLCISHPLGCRYYLGDWDAQTEQFVPKKHGRMNWRREEQALWGLFNRTDFFAPETVLTPDGRRVMWAWITSPGPENRLLNKTIQSLPRELSLPPDGVLRIQPLRELTSLRSDPHTIENVKLAHPLTGFSDRVPPSGGPGLQRIATLPGESAEIKITVARAEAERKLFGITLFSDGKGGGVPVMLRPETGSIRVGTTEAPFRVADLPEGEDVELRIFVDQYLVEVFINNRQALVAAFPDYRDRFAIDGYSVGAATMLKKIESWKIAPTNQGFLEARQDRRWEPQIR